MSTSKIRIAREVSEKIRDHLPNITDSETPPHLLKYSYFEGYGMVGFVEHGRSDRKYDVVELIIRSVGDGYYSTSVLRPRNDGDEWNWFEETEEGQVFVVWERVTPVPQTRYVWKSEE